MSNIISFHDQAAPAADDLVLSNGGTDLLLSVLVLAGAAIAERESEKRLLVYLAERDQTALGGGCVGFAMTELPWDRASFPTDRDFLLRTVRAARDRTGWERLGYPPNEALLGRYLDGFEALVRRITAGDIREEALTGWLAAAEGEDPVLHGFPQCVRHRVYRSCFGCLLCNSGQVYNQYI